MDIFKPGERVEVINNSTISTKMGHRATVSAVQHTYGYIDLIWDNPPGTVDKNGNNFAQMDGGYSPKDFRRIETEWDE